MLCHHLPTVLGGSSLQLARIMGIRVGVHYSWFFVLFLGIYWLQEEFGRWIEGSTERFAAAVIAAFLFFGSILLHEFGHALAARREGIGVSGIDLFFFGGFMKSTRDSDTPGEEFRVAAAGPAVTLLLFLLATGLGLVLQGTGPRLADDDSTLEVLVAFTAWMNGVLLVFNLIPAFPLDGGRIARAVVWKLSGDRHRATRFAAGVGQAFAVLLMALGVWYAIVRQDVSSGLWYFFLGWILGGAARAAVAQSAFTSRLEGVTVADIMDAEPVTIPAALPVGRAYEEFFLRYQGWPWFAVVEDDGRFAGLAHRAAVEHAAEHDAELPVRRVAGAGDQVRADAPLEVLLASEPLRRLGALIAVDADGRLRGVVTVEQVSRALHARLAPS